MCIDAAYVVHPNMIIQTGVTMSFGTGITHRKFSNSKLDTKVQLMQN